MSCGKWRPFCVGLNVVNGTNTFEIHMSLPIWTGYNLRKFLLKSYCLNGFSPAYNHMQIYINCFSVRTLWSKKDHRLPSLRCWMENYEKLYCSSWTKAVKWPTPRQQMTAICGYLICRFKTHLFTIAHLCKRLNYVPICSIDVCYYIMLCPIEWLGFAFVSTINVYYFSAYDKGHHMFKIRCTYFRVHINNFMGETFTQFPRMD